MLKIKHVLLETRVNAWHSRDAAPLRRVKKPGGTTLVGLSWHTESKHYFKFKEVVCFYIS